MSDIFISYARSTATQAQAVAEALRGAGHGVWLDDELPAHRGYAEVIEERLAAAKAVVVIWSAEAVKSEWVQSEADKAREGRKLVQLSADGARPPMPFDRIQCADLAGWAGDLAAPGWRKIMASIADLVGAGSGAAAPAADAPPLPSQASIAVLPFANRSGEPDQEYFADGMVEEITRALARSKAIFVIASGSSLSFKGETTSPREAARTLGVRYVLTGSVRKSGGRVRIAVELIDGADGKQIWADRFEDTLEDVFALQDRVALSVAGVIEPAVREADMRRVAGRPTDNMTSYDLSLRASPHLRTVGKAGVLAALALLDRAIAIDPDYGWALARAAQCHGFIVVYRWSGDVESHLAEARRLTARALAAAGDDAEVLGYVALTLNMIRADRATNAALADRAMALNPGSSLVWMVAGVTRLRAAEPQLAFECFETSLRLDPISQNRSAVLGMQGMARFNQQRFVEANALLKQSIQLRPQWPLPLAILAASHGHLGDLDAAREAIARHRILTPINISDWAGEWPADLQKLIVDGIALAGGETPAQIAGVGGAETP